MQVYERFGSKFSLQQNVATISYSPALLYLLSQPSAPDSVVSDITARVCRHGCRIPSALRSRDGRLSICRLSARGSVQHYVVATLSCEAVAR